jgi:predicted phage terminase large subunit-like protein
VSDFYTTELGFRMATSVGGVLTGRGADYLIIDDPLKPDEALSETQRNATNDWYKHTLLTRLNDKRTGCIIIIMQRLHEDDLVGHVLKLDDWDVLRFPAIAEQDETHEIRCFNKVRTVTRKAGQALHPEREPLETLQTIKAAIGEYLFAGQYQQSPAPLDGGIVKRSWFQRYSPLELPTKFEMVFQSWDTANKAAEIHDFSVCTTWGVYQKHLFLLNVLRKRMEYPELRRTVVSHAQFYNAQRVVIEDKASGTQLLQDLKYDAFHPATAFKAEGDKQIRLFTVTSTIENGLVHVPEVAEWAELYLYELTLFPNGKFADQVDSTSQALAWYAEHAVRHRYGVLEWAAQLKAEPMGGTESTPRTCSKCNEELRQRIPGGLRCAHCGVQVSFAQKSKMLPPR